MCVSTCCDADCQLLWLYLQASGVLAAAAADPCQSQSSQLAFVVVVVAYHHI